MTCPVSTTTPRIPQDYFFVKVNDLQTEDIGLTRPRIWVKLRIGPMHKDQSGTHLYSIIHPTDASIYYYKNFVDTFLISGNRYHEAINRWGSIRVLDAKYDKTKYSAVQYHYQTHDVRFKLMAIEEAERQGQLHWPDDLSRSARPVHGQLCDPNDGSSQANEEFLKEALQETKQETMPMIDFG